MKRAKRALLLVGIITVAGLILATGFVDLGQAVRKIDEKSLVRLERGCIVPPTFLSEEVLRNAKAKTLRQKTEISITTVSDDARKLGISLAKGFRKSCLKPDFKSGAETYWEVFAGRAEQGWLLSAQSVIVHGKDQSQEHCLNEVIESKRLKVKGVDDGEVVFAICARPVTPELRYITDSFTNATRASPNPSELRTLEQAAALINEAMIQVAEPDYFAYGRLHMAVDENGAILAAYIPDARNVDFRNLAAALATVKGLDLTTDSAIKDHEVIWFTLMLDFQSEQVKAIPIKKIRRVREL